MSVSVRAIEEALRKRGLRHHVGAIESAGGGEYSVGGRAVLSVREAVEYVQRLAANAEAAEARRRRLDGGRAGGSV